MFGNLGIVCVCALLGTWQTNIYEATDLQMCFLGGNPHGHILNPMPLHYILGFSMIFENSDIRKSEDPAVHLHDILFSEFLYKKIAMSEVVKFRSNSSGIPDLRKSGFLEIRCPNIRFPGNLKNRICKSPAFLIFGNLDVRKSGCSDFRKFRFSDMWKSRNSEVRIFGFPNFRIFENYSSADV